MMLLATLLLAPAFAGKMPSERPTDLVRGKELYERHCVACHGATNHGDGPATEALVHPVPDLAGKIEVEAAVDLRGKKTGMIRRVDEEMVRVVLWGTGAMPSYVPSFPKADARRVVFYMGLVHLPAAEREPEPKDKAPKDKEGT